MQIISKELCEKEEIFFSLYFQKFNACEQKVSTE